MNAFDTRSMLRMVEEMKPSNTFLRDTFFKEHTYFNTEHVDVDIYKGSRKVAQHVSDAIGSVTVERNEFKMETYKPELVAVDVITTAEDVLKRSMGESIYGSLSPDARMAQILARDLRELDSMITRKEEIMCSEALFQGKCTIKGAGINKEIDYCLTNTEALSDKNSWILDTSDPIADLRRWRRAIIQKCGLSPDVAVLGSDAADRFLANEKIQKLLNILNLDFGSIAPKVLANGVTFIGYLPIVGLNLYSYDEWYLNDKGKELPMVPVDKVLVGTTTARSSMLYGAVVDAARGTFALPRVPKTWIQEKPSARYLQLSCRPLAVPHQIDSIFVAKVL